MNLQNRITTSHGDGFPASRGDDFPFGDRERVTAFDAYQTLINIGIGGADLGVLVTGYLDEYGPIITDSDNDVMIRQAALIELDELYCVSRDPALRAVLDHYRREGHYDRWGIDARFLEYDPVIPETVEVSDSSDDFQHEDMGDVCPTRRWLELRDEYFSEGVPTKMHRGPGNHLMTDVGTGFYQRNPGLGSAIVSWGATIGALVSAAYFVYSS